MITGDIYRTEVFTCKEIKITILTRVFGDICFFFLAELYFVWSSVTLENSHKDNEPGTSKVVTIKSNDISSPIKS